MRAQRLKVEVATLLVAGLASLSACGVASSAPPLADPRAHTICVGVVDTRCAAQAAALAGHAVAWVPVTKSQSRAKMTVLTSAAGYVIEKLDVGSVEIALESPAIEGVVETIPPSKLSWNGGSGTLRLDRQPGVQLSTLTWLHGGVKVKLTMIDSGVDPLVVRKIANMVQYSRP